MDRKFVIALSSLAGSMMLTEAHAIGLGEIKLRTALNEPLRADIQLVQVKDLTENEILVNLASKEDFDRAGVDRDFLLTSLRFRLDLDDPANPKVMVTTQQPVREPFLNFLVEVQWPNGRLLREYTLLMDLPAFADSSAGSARSLKGTQVPAGVALPEEETVSEVGAEPEVRHEPVKTPVASKSAASSVKVRRATKEEIAGYKPPAAAVEEEQPVAEQTAAEPVPAAEKPAAVEPAAEEVAVPPPAEEPSPVAEDQYGPTGNGDTLWKIAQRVRSTGTIQQNMVAIQRLNPEAFAKGNINQLKKGQVLKLPSQEEIASIGKSEAIAEINAQSDSWKKAKAPEVAGPQLDATGRPQDAAAGSAAQEGQLTLAAPAASTAAQAGQGAGESTSSEVAQLENELTVGMEELNRAQRENQEISSRAKDLDGQIENAERLLELQNSELAAMQAKLAAEQQAKVEAEAQAKADAEAAAAAKAAAEAQAKADADAAAKVEAEAQAKVDAEAAAIAKAAAEAQVPVAAEPAPAAAAPAEQAPLPVAEQQPSVPASETTTAPEITPAPAAEPAKPEEPVAAEKPKPEPAIVPAPASSPAPAEPFLTTPVIGAIVGVIVLLLGLFGYRKVASRRSEVEEEQDYDAGIDYVPGQHEAESVAVADIGREVAEAMKAAETTAAQEAEPAPVAEEPQPETGDVLGEADIYISFGNFDKGEALLQSAIKGEPGRTDYRLKLLELYKEADNLAAFDQAYKDLVELDDDHANARAGELRSKISGAAAQPFAFGAASMAAASGISDEIDLDFDLDLDAAAGDPASEPVAEDFGLDLGEAAPSEQASGELDLDFDLDLDLAKTEEPLEDLATDFSLDFDTSETLAEPVVEETALAADDLDLDFDLDTGSVAVEEPAPAAVSAPAAVEELENPVLDAVTADAGEVDEELDFLSDADESATKLDLARAYIDMGDKDGARDILAEVMEEGRDEQKREAQALLDSIG